jgi:O-antigen/teichoic acid export membrane protein
MQIQNHIAKISWTIADKSLFVIYGFVFLIQISLISLSDLALFNFLIAINTWMFVISDSFALQSIIQFGFDNENQRKVNLYSIILHISIILILSAIVHLLRFTIAEAMSEPRFLEVTAYLPYLSLFMIPRTYCLKLMLREHSMNKIFLTNLAFFGIMVFKILSYKFSGQKINLDSAVYIYLEGAVLSSIIAVLLTIKQLRFSLKGNFKLKNIVSFSVPYTFTTALYTATRYLDILILKLFFPLEQIGIYSAAKSLFRFFEEGINGVNGLIYPASVRAVSNKDKILLQSMISKAISFTLIGFVGISLILSLGLAEFIIGTLMKSNFVRSLDFFKMILVASLFLPFNILYFVITASGKHLELMKIVALSFGFAILSFIIIGLSGISILMPLGYVSFYFAFAVQALIYVNKNDIVEIRFKDLFRAFDDSLKFIQKKMK